MIDSAILFYINFCGLCENYIMYYILYVFPILLKNYKLMKSPRYLYTKKSVHDA